MRSFHKCAAVIAVGILVAVAMNVASAAPKRPGVTPDLVAGAIALLEFNHDPTEWTQGGKPKVAAIEKILNADISAADRDLAWQSHKAGPAGAGAAAQLEADLSAAVQDRDDALADSLETRRALEVMTRERGRWQDRAERAEASIEAVRRSAQAAQARYEGLMADAEADRAAAARLQREARSVLADAEARERGAGPPASRDCREALRDLVIDADVGWLSGDVKVDEKGRSALAGACLYSD